MLKVRNGVGELRKELGWSQGALAAAVGVSRQSINSIERGRYIPSLELALRFAQLFGCPADEIFWLEDDDSNSSRDVFISSSGPSS